MTRQHDQLSAGNDRAGSDDDGSRNPGDRPAALKVAEWVTLGTSITLVLTVAGFLLYHAIQQQPQLLPLTIELQVDQTERRGDQFILPVRLRNDGGRTMRDLVAELRWTPPGAAEERREIRVDYLGERAQQTIYLYLTIDPRMTHITAVPMQYMLD